MSEARVGEVWLLKWMTLKPELVLIVRRDVGVATCLDLETGSVSRYNPELFHTGQAERIA